MKFKNHFIYYAALSTIAIILLLPFSWVRVLGKIFGWLVYVFSKNEKEKTLESISLAFSSQMNKVDQKKMAKAVWLGVGRNLFEVIRQLNWTREEITSQVTQVQGLEFFEKALKRGKGLFVITAHLGNWELLGGYLGTLGKGSALAQNLYDPRFDHLVNWFRSEKLGAALMIKRGFALRGILDALKEGQFILALCDQDTGNEGVFVNFFGRQAWTQSGVARIARKTGAALVPAFMVRGKEGNFELHVEKEIEVPQTGDKEKDILETVQKYTEVIENYVRSYPEQWMWMHERWKTKPKKDNWPF